MTNPRFSMICRLHSAELITLTKRKGVAGKWISAFGNRFL